MHRLSVTLAACSDLGPSETNGSTSIALQCFTSKGRWHEIRNHIQRSYLILPDHMEGSLCSLGFRLSHKV